MKYYSLYFGQAYGEGDYGTGTYSCTTQQQADGVCSVAGSAGSSGGGGSLADTGVGIVAVATLACLIIFVALIIRVWRRKPALQPVPVEADTTEEQPTNRQ